MSAIRVPDTLGKTPFTATPMYLQLYVRETKDLDAGNGGKWREIKTSEVESGISYILPAPKIGMGLGTHSENMDEVEFWQVSSVGDKARMILGDTIFYGVSKVVEGFAGSQGLANYNYIFGKSQIPKDLSALQFKGNRKRAYNFSFELFAYEQNDHVDIRDFCNSMHKACMVKGRSQTSSGGVDEIVLNTPAVFSFKIHSGNAEGAVGNEITNNFFLSPKPCMMIGFNSSAVDYMAINSSYEYPSRVAINMILAEIEPVVVDQSGNVVSMFEI